MKLFIRLVFLIFLGLFLFGLVQGRAQFFFSGNSLEGQLASDFTLPTLTQGRVRFSEYRQEKAAIIFFWATWCPHCWTALREIDQNFDEIYNQGIALVLVNIGETRGTVETQMKRNQIKRDVFLDEQSLTAQDYQVVGIPTFILVNKQGVVVKSQNAFPRDYQALLTQ